MTTRIYCPKCGFEPPPNLRWICLPGCRHKWNTFATHGICPRCGKMWRETQCPHCKLWSLLDDWYHDDGPMQHEEIQVNREIEIEKT